VKVDTIIITFQISKGEGNKIEIIVYEGFDRINEITPITAHHNFFVTQTDWQKDKHHIFRINVDESINTLLERIETDSKRLIECAEFSLGLTPYDKYRGQTEEQIINKVFHSNYKKDETFKKLLAGNDVRRYTVSWNAEEWISYGNWLGAPREQKFFTSKRILVKQIIDWSSKRIWSALTEEELYNTQNAFNLIAKEGYATEYLLALINSKLMTYYHKKKFLEEYKDRFQKILIKDCKEFPIKKIEKSEQQPFINKADIMLSKNKELQQVSNQFTQFLQAKYATININNKLESWYTLTANEFLKELNKQKIKLTLSEQQEWLQYFEEQKTKANNIQSLISQTDKEIDAMVYELYGLTAEEIKIVEGDK
jgi:hypothetical protein